MKISIITTNYNTDKYLEKTIKSIINQKGDFEIEYIITDGGSTDNSLNIIRKYAKECKRSKYKHVDFKWISEKDKGQSDGINKGLKMATGDIIAFLNADDLYTKYALSKVMKYFKENKSCMWLTGYCRIIDENGKEVRKSITRYKNSQLNKITLNRLLVEDFISQPSTFWRKELMDEFGYLDESLHYAMDHDYWCRFESKYHVHLIKEYLAEFRFTSDTKTGSSIDKTLRDSRIVAERYTKNKFVLAQQWLSNLKRIFVYKFVDPIINKLK